MKKGLKILGIVLGSFVALFVAAAVLIPIVFKDEIHAEIKRTINRNVRAVVDYKDVSLSLLRNFPNLSVGLEGLQVVGVDEFRGDTLARMGRFDLALDIMSVINGGEIDVKKVLLKDAYLHVIVLKDGRANYDIAIPDSAKPDTGAAAEPSKFKLKLKKYALENVNLIYDDRQGNLYVGLKELNHSGSGNLTADVYDLSTTTRIRELLLRMDGTTYANRLQMGADIDLNIDMPKSTYTLSRGDLTLNALKLALTGSVAMPAEGIRTDIKFSAAETEFRNILSLIPAIFLKDFNSLKTSGTLALDGFVKGLYNDRSMPALGLNLLVQNGMFQYPDLPTPVNNVQIDLKVNSPENDLNHMRIELKKFHADLGPNPVDATALVTSITPLNIDATVNGKLDLENVTRIFPLEGMELKGKLALNARALGVYFEDTYPALQATVDLRQGYVKTKEFPAAIENITLAGTATNKTGKMQDMLVEVSNLHVEVDKEPIDASFRVQNLDDPDYKVKLKGRVDLGKLTKIYPLEGMELAGLVNADIATEGRLSTVTNKQYENLPTSGTLTLKNFQYKAADLPAPLNISNALLNFTPAYLQLEELTGTAGQSDFYLSGRVQNYMAYVLRGDTLRAVVNLDSKRLNANEWLSSSPAPAADQPKDTTPLVAPEVPANLNVLFTTNVGEILYDQYILQNFKGGVRLVNRRLALQNTQFDLLGGQFALSGAYATPRPEKPEYDLNFDVRNLDIQKAQKAFPIVKKYLAVAENTYGNLNTTFRINGKMLRDLSMDYPTMNGGGKLELVNAELREVKVLNTIADLTRMNDLRNPKLGTTSFSFGITNGRINIQPFNLNVKDYKATLGGSTGLDQTIAYDLALDVPTGPLGTAAASALSNLIKTKLEAPTRLNLNFGIGGTVKNPKVTPKGGGPAGGGGAGGGIVGNLQNQAEELKKQAEERARAEADKLKAEAEARARAEADRLKREAEERSKAEAERLKREAEAKARAEADRLKREAEERAKKMFRF